MSSKLQPPESFYLTFDGAPHAPNTYRILDVLKKHNVKATFFMEGLRVANEPECARAVFSQGHALGNHSYTHRDLLELPFEECVAEIKRTDEAIESLLGFIPTPVRPPNGHISPEFKQYLREKNRPVVLWSISVKDWLGPDEESLAERLVSQMTADTVTAVFHDFVQWTPGAVDLAIPRIKDLGYEFKIYGREQINTPSE